MALPAEVQELSRGSEARESAPTLDELLSRLREAKANGTYEEAVNEILAFAPEAANDDVEATRAVEESESEKTAADVHAIALGRQRTSFVGAAGEGAAHHVEETTPESPEVTPETQNVETAAETITVESVKGLLELLDAEIQKKNLLHFLEKHPEVLSARARAKEIHEGSDPNEVINAYNELKAAMGRAGIDINTKAGGGEGVPEETDTEEKEETKIPRIEPWPTGEEVKEDPAVGIPTPEVPPTAPPLPPLEQPAVGRQAVSTETVEPSLKDAVSDLEGIEKMGNSIDLMDTNAVIAFATKEGEGVFEGTDLSPEAIVAEMQRMAKEELANKSV